VQKNWKEGTPVSESKSDDRRLRQDTLDFILGYTKGAPEQQLRDAEALDSKSVQALSIGSVVIGLLGVAVGYAHANSVLFVLLPCLAGAAYLGVVVSCFRHLGTKQFNRSLHADALWQCYWNEEVSDIKHSLVASISEAYHLNKSILDAKAETLKWALGCLAAESLFVGAFVLLSLATLNSIGL
jgi:hypothetical protein